MRINYGFSSRLTARLPLYAIVLIAYVWSDFEFHATTKALSSVFFLSQEEQTGIWLHETGPVDSKNLAQYGLLTLLKLPQLLHDLGKQ